MFEHTFCKDEKRDFTYGCVILIRLKLEPKHQSTLKENAIRTPSKSPKHTRNLVSFPSVVSLYRVGTVSKATAFLTNILGIDYAKVFFNNLCLYILENVMITCVFDLKFRFFKITLHLPIKLTLNSRVSILHGSFFQGMH